MLLNNNGPSEPVVLQQQQQGNGGVFRRSKHDPSRNNNNNVSSKKKTKAAGGSSVRNSWSFAAELPVQTHAPVQQAKESIYADPELLYSGSNADPVKAVSRSRLRQRSVSNLTASSLAGLRASRDHSSSNRPSNANGGTVKGVDYIRLAPATPARQQMIVPVQQTELTIVPIAIDAIQDRSEYGNPDGSSAHSTAEREGSCSNSITKSVAVDLYQAINQNQNNDYKMSQGYFIQPAEVGAAEVAPTNRSLEKQQEQLVRNGSGRSSATTASFPSGRAEAGPRASSSRKSPAPLVASSTGPNAVKTEWTFLPSPAAEPVHREINSKPEVKARRSLYFLFLLFQRHPCFARRTHARGGNGPDVCRGDKN